MKAPYKVEPFGEVGIPSDWRFYTPLAERLRRANNEEAMQDLCDLIARIRRSRLARYEEALGSPVMVTMAGTERLVKGK